MQINLENKIQERQYRITYWPICYSIFMKDHDYFDDIGPQTNKSLKLAFHQLLKKKENKIWVVQR